MDPLSLWEYILKLFFFWIYLQEEKVKDVERPNIVLIVADDMGWNDVGFHGSSQILTPNLDALAYNGVILNRHYSQQTCTPSRAALLTGNYPIRSAMQGIPITAGQDRSLPLGMPTMPEKLKNLGYKTHLVGKWHLGQPYRSSTPTERGFDTHYGYWNGFIGYFQHFAQGTNALNKTAEGLDMHQGFEPRWPDEGKYATELFTDRASEIIRSSNEKEPFFLMVSHLAPHAGINGTELGVPNVESAHEKYSYISNHQRQLYAEVVTQLDKSVGQIVTTLEAKGVLNNTIIVFIADNGAQTQGIYENFGSNWPLRGLKFTLFEGGVRTAAAVYYSKIKNKGRVSNSLFHISDWFPTFYTAAGGNVDDLGKIDGINQWDVLKEEAPTERTEILLNIDELQNTSGYIGFNGRYKLVNGSYANGIYDQHYGDSGRESNTPPYNVEAVLQSDTQRAIKGCLPSNRDYNFTCPAFCLFDLEQDPCETTDVIDALPGVGEELKEKLASYWSQIDPQTSLYVDPRADPIHCNGVWFNWLDESRDIECGHVV